MSMVAYLKGKINYKSAALKKDNFLVIDVGGVGYKVYALEKTVNEMKIGEEKEFFIHTQVAENALDLYGFITREELDFFEILISLPGIGPKSAMDILNKAKIEDLRSAAQSGKADILSRMSGIGPKTAQKITAGLKEKFGGLDGLVGWSGDFGDALEALVNLGYPVYAAREALAKCQAADAGEKIKEALKILGGKK